MKIKNVEKLMAVGYPRIEDIEPGECFTFLDDETLYMKTTGEFIIAVGDGELSDWDEHNEDRPVRRIRTEITVLD